MAGLKLLLQTPSIAYSGTLSLHSSISYSNIIKNELNLNDSLNSSSLPYIYFQCTVAAIEVCMSSILAAIAHLPAPKCKPYWQHSFRICPNGSPFPSGCFPCGPCVGQSMFRYINIVIIVQLGMPSVTWHQVPMLVVWTNIYYIYIEKKYLYIFVIKKMKQSCTL